MTVEGEALALQMRREVEPHRGDRQTTTLWHYTSDAVARLILAGRSMHATHFGHLNDSTELILGEALVREAAKNLCVKAMFNDPRLDLAMAFFQVYESGQRLSKLTSAFVVSYSELGDDAGMWEAHGDGGRGCSIGFTEVAGEGREIGPDWTVASNLLRLRYDHQAIVAECHDLLHSQTLAVQDWIDRHPEHRKDLRAEGGAMLLRTAASFAIRGKDAQYSAQREWRCFAVPVPGRPSAVLEKDTPRGRTPYVVLAFDDAGPIPIEGVRMGPRATAEQRSEFVEFLGSLGYADPETLVLSSAR